MIECMVTQSKFNPYNPDTAAEMMGMDREIIIELAREYLGYVTEELDNLQIAIENSNYKDIAFSSHKIKGVAANLGMVHVSKMASHINSNAVKMVKIDYNLYYSSLEKLLNIANSQLQKQSKSK